MADNIGIQGALNLIAGTQNLAVQGAANAAATRTGSLENYMGLLTTGQESCSRYVAASNTTMTSQLLRLSYFTARKSEAAANCRINSAGTAAGATPTLVRFGLYSVATNGDLTLIASTPNDTTLLAGTNTAYTKAFSVATTVTAGSRYAMGLLVVTGATAPTVTAASLGNGNEMNQLPRLCNTVAGQADLPSPIAVGSLATGSAAPYLVITP